MPVFRTFIVSQSAALFILFFSRHCQPIKTKPRIIHLTLATIILKKLKKNNIFCWSFQQTSLWRDSKVINVRPIILIVVITILSPACDADAFYWSTKWSLRCLPVNRRPIKRRLLSWQLPREQTTDVRARMIAWSEDTWWEAAPVLQSQPGWDGSSVRSEVGGVESSNSRPLSDVRLVVVGGLSGWRSSARHFLPGFLLLPTRSDSFKHWSLKTGGETTNRLIFTDPLFHWCWLLVPLLYFVQMLLLMHLHIHPFVFNILLCYFQLDGEGELTKPFR